jgi:hypothetical protein
MPQPLIPAQPLVPAIETVAAVSADRPVLNQPIPEPEPNGTYLPPALIALQQAADHEREKLKFLDGHDERTHQRRAWFEAAAAAQAAITRYARAERLNRFDVEQEVRRVVKDSDHVSG